MIYQTTIDLSPADAGDGTARLLPRRVDIEVARGSDFIWQIIVQPPLDGLGWNQGDGVASAAFKWRNEIGSSTVVEEGSTAGDYLTVDDTDTANIVLTIDMPAADTAALVFSGSATVLGTSTEISGFRRGGAGVHDLEVTLDSGRVWRVVEGTITLSDEVTR